MRKIFLIWIAFLLLAANVAWAQSRTVSGKVTGASDGEGLPGANIVVKGTTRGTQTDFEGKYSLSLEASDNVLVISFVGMTTKEVEIGTQTTIDVILSDAIELEEVVVVGYGTQLKKEFSGASATVDTKAIEKLPVLSVDQALQGQAAGVQVTSSSGTPGGGISVKVRGQNSAAAGNNPLYIVDGVPIISGDLSSGWFGNQGQNLLAGLNPDDIASIEVLKDAGSTAIYGARAANGVVLITTKRGKAGGSEFNLNIMRGQVQETNRITMLNSEQYAMIRNEARTNDGFAPLNIPTDVSTDWLDQVFRKGLVEQYQLNASGGDEKTRYYLSSSLRNEEGAMIGAAFKRATLRMNLDHKATDKLSFGVSSSFSRDRANRIHNDNDIFGVLSTAILTQPYIPVYDEEGNYSATPFAHPISTAIEPRYENTTYKATANLYVNYKIMKDLSFKVDFNGDFAYLREDHYEPSITYQGSSTNGWGYYGANEAGRYAVEPQLNYAKTMNDVHKFNMFLGSTIQQNYNRSGSVVGENFGRDDINYINSAALITGGSSSFIMSGFSSIFGRGSYSYDGKYNLSATIRRDGSSKFGPNYRWGNFWALSGNWIVTDEAFMEQFEFINMLKLRAGYGVRGNDQISSFSFLGTWGVGGNYLDLPASSPATIANDNLKWESTGTLDLGVEFSLLNNRLNFNLGYYKSKTTDLLWPSPIPSTTGFSSVWDNIGVMTNRGFEFEIRGVALDMNDFKWNINFNVATLKNQLVSLVDDEPILSGFGSVIKAGYPMSSFWGLDYQGIDPETGDAIFRDVNGDGEITVDDNTIIGDHMADFYGGITNSFSYKGLSLDVFFQFTQGVQIYNNNGEFIRTVGANSFNQDNTVLNRWQNPGDVTTVPRAATGATAGLNNATSSRFLEDGSYLRLKNITLSYTLPKAIVKKAYLRSARVAVGAQNILTFTKYTGFDPEVSTFAQSNTAAGTDFLTFPQTKIYTFNLTLGF